MASDGVAGGKLLTEGKWAGWATWSDPNPDTFVQAIGCGYARGDGVGKALIGVETRSSHRNRIDALHGGFLAAFADYAYFGGLWVMGHDGQGDGVTLDLTMQYLGAGKVGPDLFAQVELLRETGRFYFMRMMLVQNGEPITASTATIRKASRSKAAPAA